MAVAVLLHVAGVPARTVADEYATGADRMADIFARLSKMPSYGDAIDTMPAGARVTEAVTMERFLAEIEDRHGGSAGSSSTGGSTPRPSTPCAPGSPSRPELRRRRPKAVRRVRRERWRGQSSPGADSLVRQASQLQPGPEGVIKSTPTLPVMTLEGVPTGANRTRFSTWPTDDTLVLTALLMVITLGGAALPLGFWLLTLLHAFVLPFCGKWSCSSPPGRATTRSPSGSWSARRR